MLKSSTVAPLTKSEYLSGRECPKRMWLDRFLPSLKAAPTAAEIERMETGRAVGTLARERYPDGVPAPYVGLDVETAAEETRRRIEEGATCLFEATFVANGRLARVDVLVADGEGGWIVDEVKSSTVKPANELKAKGLLHDLTFQIETVRAAGHRVTGAGLVLIDSRAPWPGGPYDASTLLQRVDVTAECEALAPEVSLEAETLIEDLKRSTPPEIETNLHCKGCAFYAFCHPNPSRYDVVHLPRITRERVTELRKSGYREIGDLPATEKLSPIQRRVWESVRRGTPQAEPGLAAALDELRFPAAFVDFETCHPALPAYPGTTPFTQICFQWSVHVLPSPDAEPVHHEFLHALPGDPREAFCAALWEVVRGGESFVHYSAFERTQIRAMAEAGIPQASELLAFIDARGFDLEKVVKEHVCHPEFVGRSSIKVVLPALVPGMSYKGLAIGNGEAASAAFRQMVHPDTAPDEAATLYRDLLAYCRQDTLAMVEVFRALRRLAS